ncbi:MULTISPECIES: heavy-metal-associated domain-containing protein [Xanthomonas]|uniref:heavy-metal-associated domain-containing protein n=1 Tax=Xanthomonas TaxID=338 RepID=UPI001883FFF6|nr:MULTISPECIES: cation transporter [Xanthomonas]QOX05544.1 cation transporter [Xanthomonas sp. WG16]QXF04335.1 cation transporter [Xanthomonas citri pv. citri]
MLKLVIGLVVMMWAGLALAATPKKVMLDVENMTCPACNITIEKALDKVPGVTGRQVDAKAATVTVTFDAERTNVPAVVRAITEAGFPAKARANGG